MNIPTTPKGFVKTFLKVAEWVLLGLLMPDLLLLIAICELYAAIKLLRNAYRYLDDIPPPPGGWFYSCVLLRGICPSDEYKVNSRECI